MIKISVITPTVRTKEIHIVATSLQRQSFIDFEWIIVTPSFYAHANYIDGNEILDKDDPFKVFGNKINIIYEQKKREGDFYNLNKAYNQGFRQAKGDLIISYQDGIEIRPDTLERFWNHYQSNPKSCTGAVGDQYSTLNPPVKVWVDPRRKDSGALYECYEIDIEFTLCSIPRRAIIDVGGMDEEYDLGAAVGEKEMMKRIYMAGYKTYIDQSIEYKALKHERLTKDWDHYYSIASSLFSKHVYELERGERNIHLDYLD